MKIRRMIVCLMVAALVMACVPAGAESTAGIIRGKVTDNNSNMLIASIFVEGEDGTTYRTFTNAMGGYTLGLEPGTYTLTFSKGNEYDTVTKTVTVERLKTSYQPDVRLTALYDSYAKGWVAGDCHQHTYYSDGVNSVEESMVGNAAAGLYFGYLTDHNSSRGVPEWNGLLKMNVRVENGEPRYFQGFDGVELTTEFGHYNSLGTGLTLETYDLKLTEFERASSDKLTYAREKIKYIADCIRRIGGIAQMNHPYSSTTMGVMNWIEKGDWEVFDLFDTVEVWNGYFVPPDGIWDTQNAMNQNYSTKLLWYELLNGMKDGHSFHAITGGTDNHDISSPVSGTSHEKYTSSEPTDLESYYYYWVNTAKYNGMPTTYVYLNGAEVNAENVAECIRDGHSFVSDGPVVICDIDGKTYGEKVAIPADGTLTLNTDVWNRDGISEIRIVVNGETVETIRVDEGTTEYTQPVTLTGEWESLDWILVEVLGPLGQYAVTNPIIVE